MATYREIVYSILDLLKERSDDSFYTEEHVLFFASKVRALLLERKYRGSRNATFNMQPEDNRQRICLGLEPTEILPYGCEGMWLKSIQKVPEMLSISEPRVSVVNDLMHSHVSYVAPERMPYVGYNKWLTNIIYASRSKDGYLYLNSGNPQFVNLENIMLDAVFADAEEAEKLACETSDDGTCDIMDKAFPLEDALIPSCIEIVVQELSGARYAPQDEENNDRDDLAHVRYPNARAYSPAENIASKIKYPQQETQQEA